MTRRKIVVGLSLVATLVMSATSAAADPVSDAVEYATQRHPDSGWANGAAYMDSQHSCVEGASGHMYAAPDSSSPDATWQFDTDDPNDPGEVLSPSHGRGRLALCGYVAPDDGWRWCDGQPSWTSWRDLCRDGDEGGPVPGTTGWGGQGMFEYDSGHRVRLANVGWDTEVDGQFSFLSSVVVLRGDVVDADGDPIGTFTAPMWLAGGPRRVIVVAMSWSIVYSEV